MQVSDDKRGSQITFYSFFPLMHVNIHVAAKKMQIIVETEKINYNYSKVYVISSPEPSGSQGELIVYPCSVVHPSVVHHFQRSSPLKPLGQSKPNFT